MEDNLGLQDRRNSFRFEMNYPAIYTRFDDQGRAYDQKPSRLMDLNLGGVRLESRFAVESGELLDIAMALENRLVALEDRLVTFMGKVLYLIPTRDQDIQMGIFIKEIKDGERKKLSRFIERLPASDPHDNVIIQSGQIVCPNCGEQVESVARVKQVTTYYKGFRDHCSCGQRYEAKPHSSDRMILSFPDREVEIIC